jgi:two-component system sensor histidine kinase KdpD
MVSRPDPDELLRQVAAAERREARGTLIVFFGAAPGVGKTYAMLEAARSERDLKRDVVVGIVETHGRYDTGALVLGLEILPRRDVEHRGVVLKELDLDAALARRPGLILIDELAHTNAPGSRHAKRWQDVEELLDAGIDVYTTLNVQHVDSLNDVVAQVTGVVVRERVPDRVLDEATEVRLIDLPPDELLERLGEGKVYLPDQAAHATANFFRKGNLIALRELALRRTAERVDAQMRTYRTEHGIEGVWATGERILVGISPSPASARLLRAARRMAGSLHAEWIGLYVETPASLRLGERAREQLAANLRLAEELGARAVTASADNAADETLRYARAHNVTKIVVGKPTHARWRDLFGRPFLDQMVRGSGDIDVYVISGADAAGRAPSVRPRDDQATTSQASAALRKTRGRSYGTAAGLVILATGVARLFGPQRLPDVVMTYLLGIILTAMQGGYGPSLAASLVSVFALDFFFVPPFYSFAVADVQHTLTFTVMFVVALVISSLTERLREQSAAVRAREERTASLYALTRQLVGARAPSALRAVVARQLHELFGADVSLSWVDESGKLVDEPAQIEAPEPHGYLLDERERAVAAWAAGNARSAGLGTDTLPSASALYLPLVGARGVLGVLGLRPQTPRRFADAESRTLLEVFSAQIASALERTRLAEEAQSTQVQIEAERLRSSLLSSVSHDLRTPLAVITGSASALLGSAPADMSGPRRDLLVTIGEEADRLNRLVRNLLDMTRITAGAIKVNREWQSLDGLVGEALERTESVLRDRPVEIDVPPDLPLVPVDAVLVEQVLINLLENAAKYSPADRPITLVARARTGATAADPAAPREVELEIADRGAGIPDDQLEKIFEKFYRLPRERAGEGAGLGLSICRGIVRAHGGRIWAENREGGGARLRFTLPIDTELQAPAEEPA